MIVRVTAAFRDSGGRNAWTALLIASVPVIAVQPPENARRSRNRVRAWVIGTCGNSAAVGATRSVVITL